MRCLRHIIVVLAFAGLVAVLGPSSALASGCNGSAGDNQYVDPLQNCNGGSTGTSTTPTTPTTTPTPSTSTTPTSPSTPTANAGDPTSSTTTTAAAADPKSSKTLPYTGLDIAPALIVAFALLGGGFVLRRVVTDR